MPIKITGISVTGNIQGNSVPMYSAPTITSIIPTSGSSTGGTTITIVGTDFVDVQSVSIGGNPAASYTVDSETVITAVTPAGTEGPASVSVTTDYGTSAPNTLFTYLPPGDPYWNNVVLLVQNDYANGTTTVVDSSNSAKTATVVGVTNSTAVVPPFGTSSIRSPNTSGARTYFSYPDSEDWNFGNGNFTVEMWVRVAAFNSNDNTFWAQLDSQGYAPLRLSVSTGGFRARFQPVSWGTGTFWTGTVSTNTWYHVAVVRNGTSIQIYINGQAGTALSIGTTSLANTSDPLYIAGIPTNTNNANQLNGYVKGVRVTKGVARYTSNFTVPTGPFPAY